jgi:F0F1-type ATP synthase membrane subunit a
MLIKLIVIIETISNLIRQGTLAVCLTTNVIAGHLLLSLLGNNGASVITSVAINGLGGSSLENTKVTNKTFRVIFVIVVFLCYFMVTFLNSPDNTELFKS